METTIEKSKRTVVILLHYQSDKLGFNAQVETNGVPRSLIVESLQNLTTGLSAALVREAARDVEEKDLEAYLDATLNVDREKLKRILASE